MTEDKARILADGILSSYNFEQSSFSNGDLSASDHYRTTTLTMIGTLGLILHGLNEQPHGRYYFDYLPILEDEVLDHEGKVSALIRLIRE